MVLHTTPVGIGEKFWISKCEILHFGHINPQFRNPKSAILPGNLPKDVHEILGIPAVYDAWLLFCVTDVLRLKFSQTLEQQGEFELTTPTQRREEHER